MRELGFSIMWPKLEQDQCTTFRFPRKDKDWEVAEIVKVVFHPRGKDRKVLGTAQIIGKQPRILQEASSFDPPIISQVEAQDDGFESLLSMRNWMRQKYGYPGLYKPMNKLTILWIKKEGK